MSNLASFHLPFSDRTTSAPSAAPSKARDMIEITDTSTLDGVFRMRVRRTPHATAYLQYNPASQTWDEYSWQDIAAEVARWQAALKTLNLRLGERVALMLNNCREWVIFDQAAIGLGLVTVPLYTSDRADNIDWVLTHAGCRVLLIGSPEHWRELQSIRPTLEQLDAVLRSCRWKTPPPTCASSTTGCLPGGARPTRT